MTLRVATVCLAVVLLTTLASGSVAPTKLENDQPLKDKVTEETLFRPLSNSKPLRILGVFPFNAYSHFIMFKRLMLELARRGHQVTMINPFPLKEKVPNYRDVDLSKEFPSLISTYDFTKTVEMFSSKNPFVIAMGISFVAGPSLCRKVFSLPKVQEVISGKEKFDVVFTEIFASECFLAIGHKLQVPTISIATSNGFPWTADYMGDISNPAYVEGATLTPSSDGLKTLWRRLQNTIGYLSMKLGYYIFSTRPSEAVVREFFGEDTPSLDDLSRNVSLVMVNTHPSVFGVKPTVPRYLPVAGIHIQNPDPKKLPKDVKDWLDSAHDGVLYFTLGSLVRSDSIPPRLMKAIITAFARLKPVRILWKFEGDAKAAGIPDNVKVAPWLPQMEILSHPNVRAFMSHGGLMSTLETVYNGVPLVGLPLFADQAKNIFLLQELGAAVSLDHRVVDADDIFNAINKTMFDSEVQQKTKQLSRIFRDRPQSPLDSAVWWTEYIARHGGAPHLESPTASMPFWQYALLDVVAALLAVFLVAIATVYFLVKLILLPFRKSAPVTSPAKKKN